MLHLRRNKSQIAPKFPTKAIKSPRSTIKYHDRLGICIGIHGGLVWGYYILNVGNLLQYTKTVPDWITGIDGNPIAGILGLIFLYLLLVWMTPKIK
jgi:hypothetical protein